MAPAAGRRGGIEEAIRAPRRAALPAPPPRASAAAAYRSVLPSFPERALHASPHSPYDVFAAVCAALPDTDVLSVSLVCREWRSGALTDGVWRAQAARRGWLPPAALRGLPLPDAPPPWADALPPAAAAEAAAAERPQRAGVCAASYGVREYARDHQTMRRVQRLWRRIEARATLPHLRPPAAGAALRAVERAAGVCIPVDLRESLRVHDGQRKLGAYAFVRHHTVTPAAELLAGAAAADDDDAGPPTLLVLSPSVRCDLREGEGHGRLLRDGQPSAAFARSWEHLLAVFASAVEGATQGRADGDFVWLHDEVCMRCHDVAAAEALLRKRGAGAAHATPEK